MRPGRPENGAEQSGAGRGLSASRATGRLAPKQSGRGTTPWVLARETGKARQMAPVLRPVPWQLFEPHHVSMISFGFLFEQLLDDAPFTIIRICERSIFGLVTSLNWRVFFSHA